MTAISVHSWNTFARTPFFFSLYGSDLTSRARNSIYSYQILITRHDAFPRIIFTSNSPWWLTGNIGLGRHRTRSPSVSILRNVCYTLTYIYLSYRHAKNIVHKLYYLFRSLTRIFDYCSPRGHERREDERERERERER
jgi:hypothetical protein